MVITDFQMDIKVSHRSVIIESIDMSHTWDVWVTHESYMCHHTSMSHTCVTTHQADMGHQVTPTDMETCQPDIRKL